MSNIKELPTEFNNKHGQFKQVYKSDGWYIYSRLYLGNTYFEVFKRKIVNCFDFTTKRPTGEQKETYPNNANNYGMWAWCCRTMESALKYTTQT